jgi:hypothetical protein
VPQQDGTGGKAKLGPISKRVNDYLRRLLVNGAMSVLCSKRAKEDPWLTQLPARKQRKVVACALANKMARIGWAVMMRQEDFCRRVQDQPCPDRPQPGTVLPTGHACGLTAHAVKIAARACGGRPRPVLTEAPCGATPDPGRDAR